MRKLVFAIGLPVALIAFMIVDLGIDVPDLMRGVVHAQYYSDTDVGFPFQANGNSTTTPLGTGATFTGEWTDISAFASISIIGSGSVAGTLSAEFSTDGSSIDRALPLSDGLSGDFGIHSLIPVAKYFRVKVVNGATAQSQMRLQTLYNVNARIAQPTSRLGQVLTRFSDVLNTRAVIADVGGTNATVTDHKALQVTPPPEGKSAFGETLIAELFPSVELIFHTFINPRTLKERANQSGTVSQENNMAKLSTGAASDSSATIISSNAVRYHPGQGVRARFTGVFTTGVPGSSQSIGIGNSTDGFFFGYDGATYGVLHRRGGAPEIRTLTVTTGSSNAENITITLDGDAKTDVAVTNTADTTLTANEIAEADYSDVGRGWDTAAVGSTVIFTSWDASSRTGTYSLSSATSAVGTFAQTLVGVAKTDTWIPQTDWNGDDIFDGNGVTGVTLDPTKGNVYQITYQWLGFGKISFHVEDPDDGEMHEVHAIPYSNSSTVPSIGNPSLPLCIISENTTNTSDLIVRVGSMAAFVDGIDGLIGTRRGTRANITLGATSVETPIITIRTKEVFQNSFNRGQVKLLLVGSSADHTKPVSVNFYSNATLTGSTFADLDSSSSMIEIDTSATGFTDGTFLFAIDLGKNGNEIMDISEDLFAGVVNPGDSLTATIAPKSGNSAEASVTFNFVELF